MKNTSRSNTTAAFDADTGNAGSEDDEEDSDWPHDLEVHIEALRELDKVRNRSADYRKEGYAALEALIPKAFPAESTVQPVASTGTSAPDLIDYVAALRVHWLLSKESTDANLSSAGIKQLESTVGLDVIEAHDRSILLAAQIMQAMASLNTVALSTTNLLCWYWIIREMFSATAPDWSIGGARAAHGGHVTAYTTSQCVRSILDFSDSLKATGEFFSAIYGIVQRLNQLERLESNKGCSEWCDLDKKRLTEASVTTLSLLSNNIALDLSLTNRESPPKESTPEEKLITYLKALPGQIENELKRVSVNLSEAIDKIVSFRQKENCEKSYDKSKERRFIESETGHSIALKAIERAAENTQKAISEPAALASDWSDVDLWKNRALWKNLESDFTQAAKKIREGIKPSLNYFSTVIDRQLAVESPRASREWDPAELAFAAIGYRALSERPEEHQDRLLRATSCLCESIAVDGRVKEPLPYHVYPDGTLRNVGGAKVLGAIVDLVKEMHFPVGTRLARKLLPYFEETRAEKPAKDSEQRGWAPVHARRPRGSDLRKTADSVMALAKINRMLDNVINDIILKHFSVKYPSELKTGLDDLFYPDYGFASSSNHCAGMKRESIAVVLQKMRSHMVGQKSGASSSRKLYSLVLHGPAGTGKTTLVEALAWTCKVPLIEVTPSDIAKGGEAEIELRARTVFEALSLLSRVIILFDEFDPVLKRREVNSKHPFNIFSFLTPGMLPKLKTLNDRAKDRSVAYVLITNLIGSLDEAAIRKGRFDEKVGIYPPDLLSRYGRFMMLFTDSDGSPKEERVREVMQKTAGLGMTVLMTNGWFRRSSNKDEADTPIYFVLHEDGKLPSRLPEPEDFLPRKRRGEGTAAQKEYEEWTWINNWDGAVLSKDQSIVDWLKWPSTAGNKSITENK